MAKRPRHPVEVRRFLRAAVQRFEEAVFLLERGEFTTGAVYLAGYAVECSLKALLLSIVPVRRQAIVLASFRGARAHDFDWLRRQLLLQGLPFPRHVAQHLTEVAWWATDLRSDPRAVRGADAERFLERTRELMRWIQGRL